MIVKQAVLTTRCSEKMKQEAEEAAEKLQMNISEYFRFCVQEMNRKVLEETKENEA